MTIRFLTDVYDLPATGLLPAMLSLTHWCTRCRQRVKTDELVSHARAHIDQTQKEGDAIE
jgi:hypothetical protein